MSSLQRIFMFIQKEIFPSAWRLLLGCSHGNQRRTAGHSTFRRAPPTERLQPCQGRRSPARSQMLTSRPAAPAGGGFSRRPTSATLARSNPALPIARAGVPAPRRGSGLWWSICLLRVGGRNGLEVKIAWNAGPRAVQTALSASSGNRLGGLGQGPGLDHGSHPGACCREGTRGMPPGQTSLLCRCCLPPSVCSVRPSFP